MVSSQSTLAGRNTLQVWDLTGGSWQGVSLKGLQVAVLESASENLAVPNARAERVVIYLPDTATATQRDALVAWLKARETQLATAQVLTRVVPITLTRSAEGVRFEAGPYAALRAVSAGDCKNRVCGESLWYEPSTPTRQFTVAVNAGSEVKEPLLKLTWTAFGKRSVFVARFGGTETAGNQFVQSSEWCGPTGRLF